MWLCECISICAMGVRGQFLGRKYSQSNILGIEPSCQAWAASTLPFGAILLTFQFMFCSHHCISPAPFTRIHGQQHHTACVLQAVWESRFLERHHIQASALLLLGIVPSEGNQRILVVLFSVDSFCLEPVSLVGSLLFLEDLCTSQRN